MAAPFWKRALKTAAAGLASALGAPALLVRGRELRILCYHRVLPRERLDRVFTSPNILLAEDVFARQLDHLARRWAVVPLEEGVAGLRTGSLPRRAVAITFDDGWRDLAATAWPLLRERNLPATVYLAAGFIGGTRPFWTDRLRHLLHLARQQERRDLADLLPPGPGPLADSAALVARLKQGPPGEADALVERLEAALRAPPFPAADHAFLNWDEVRSLAAQGLGIGSHTVNHPILPRISPDEARRELAASRERIARELGRVPSGLAYPNGDHDAATRALAAEAGYAHAATLEHGPNAPATDPFRLRRIHMRPNKTRGVAAFSPSLFEMVLSRAV